jgi:hypothetical protein
LSLTIEGGEIDAIGDIGIGTGQSLEGNSTVDRLTILGGSIIASGIGAGSAENGLSTVNNLTIVNGSITSHNFNGPAIGSGHAHFGTSTEILRQRDMRGSGLGRRTWEIQVLRTW